MSAYVDKVWKKQAHKRAGINNIDDVERKILFEMYENMSDAEKEPIRRLVTAISGKHRGIKIKNFGEGSAIELIAKLGIWMNANVPPNTRFTTVIDVNEE